MENKRTSSFDSGCIVDEESEEEQKFQNEYSDQCTRVLTKAKEINKVFTDKIIGNLNNLVDEKIKRNNMILNYKFNKMLDKAKDKWSSLKAKTDKGSQSDGKNKTNKERNIENRDLNLIIQELKDYEKVAATLIKKLDGIDTNLNQEKDTNSMFNTVRIRSFISFSLSKENKDELKQWNKQNLKISYEIEDMLEKIEETKMSKVKENTDIALIKMKRNSLPNQSVNYKGGSYISRDSQIGIGDRTSDLRNSQISAYSKSNLLYPSVDMSKLNEEQTKKINDYIHEIKVLDCELRKKSTINAAKMIETKVEENK